MEEERPSVQEAESTINLPEGQAGQVSERSGFLTGIRRGLSRIAGKFTAPAPEDDPKTGWGQGF